jgi:hypothetical protein
MPQVKIQGLTINYDVQGDGEPLLLIPYTSADHACYAFQLPAYTEHFRCIAIDLPGSGESDMPPGPYSTEGHADRSLRSSAPSASRALTWQVCHSVPPWACTSPPAIQTGCARSRCTAVGMPPMPT